MDKKEQILNAFKKEGIAMRPGEIAEKTSIDPNEVSKLIKELKTEEKINSTKRCFYDLNK